jgi:Transposase IS116/IS110/IS902 family
LARQLLAGALTAVVVPSPEVEAAREMTRAHDAYRQELMRARHRVSKMLLRHGRVYPKPNTWTAEHRRWLSAQRFPETPSEMVFADLVAAVDGITSRKSAIALTLSQLATDERWWPTVARLRAFRGIDTLTALSIHLELGGDWGRFKRASALSAWLGLTPSLNQSGESSRQGAITKTGSMLHAGCWSSRPGTTAVSRGSVRRSPTANRASPITSFRYPTAPSSAFIASTAGCALAASRTTSPSWRAPASLRASSGPPPPPTDPRRQSTGRRVGALGHQAASTRDLAMSTAPPGAARSLLDSASWQHETGPWGTQPPHHQTGNADTEPGAPTQRPPPPRRPQPTRSTTPT